MCLGLASSAISSVLSSEFLGLVLASEAKFGEVVVNQGLSDAPVGESQGIRCARMARGDGWKVVCDDSVEFSWFMFQVDSLAIDVTSLSISRRVTK
jgi:hypothetical protein